MDVDTLKRCDWLVNSKLQSTQFSLNMYKNFESVVLKNEISSNRSIPSQPHMQNQMLNAQHLQFLQQQTQQSRAVFNQQHSQLQNQIPLFAPAAVSCSPQPSSLDLSLGTMDCSPTAASPAAQGSPMMPHSIQSPSQMVQMLSINSPVTQTNQIMPNSSVADTTSPANTCSQPSSPMQKATPKNQVIVPSMQNQLIQAQFQQTQQQQQQQQHPQSIQSPRQQTNFQSSQSVLARPSQALPNLSMALFAGTDVTFTNVSNLKKRKRRDLTVNRLPTSKTQRFKNMPVDQNKLQQHIVAQSVSQNGSLKLSQELQMQLDDSNGSSSNSSCSQSGLMSPDSGTGNSVNNSFPPVERINQKRRQRCAANERERKRMMNLNEAFDRLRKIMITQLQNSENKKDIRLSKFDTLRYAQVYIESLAKTLNEKS